MRKEYEMSRIELEQTLAASEQTGPINREMRNLIASLQSHNHQLKSELQRYKRKFRELQTENTRVSRDGCRLEMFLISRTSIEIIGSEIIGMVSLLLVEEC